MMTDTGFNVGLQPLDSIMSEAGLTNHAVVAASNEFLTHKVVQKARKGRKLTRRTQDKILRALNKISEGRSYQREHIFNYHGT